MCSLQGLLYDGISSQAVDATLQPSPEFGLHLTIGQQSYLILWDEIKFSSRIGNTARYITLGEHGRLETTDNDAADKLANEVKNQQKSTFLHRLESRLHWIILGLVGTVAFVYIMFVWGIPKASEIIANQIPETTSDYIETQVLNQLEKSWFNPSTLDDKRQQGIFRLFDQVKTSVGIKNKSYQLWIRDASDSVGANAFAFPHGTIVITDQLIELADNDDQIAGVLAHELGHLVNKHSLQQLVRGSISAFLITLITGDAAEISSVLVATPVILMELHYSRKFETEADQYSLQYFICSDKNSEEMAIFLGKLSLNMNPSEQPNDHSKNDVYLSDFLASHPATPTRMAMFRQLSPKLDCVDK